MCNTFPANLILHQLSISTFEGILIQENEIHNRVITRNFTRKKLTF